MKRSEMKKLVEAQLMDSFGCVDQIITNKMLARLDPYLTWDPEEPDLVFEWDASGSHWGVDANGQAWGKNSHFGSWSNSGPGWETPALGELARRIMEEEKEETKLAAIARILDE
jgi:hypothetical protein